MSKEHGQPIARPYLPADLQIEAAVGTAVASATTINLEDATGNYLTVTGTTTITGIFLGVGHKRWVRFTGALLLTNGASLILPGGVDRTTVAGDCALFVGEASGVVRCIQFQSVNGLSIAGETKFCTTEFVAVTGTTGATLTDVVGLTGFNLAAAGVYAFEAWLNGSATANCGHKIGLQLNTATLTSANYGTLAMLAATMAYTQGTTATSAVPVHGATTATLGLHVRARLIVNAAGTMDVQCAQNAAHTDETKIYVGSWARLSRVS